MAIISLFRYYLFCINLHNATSYKQIWSYNRLHCWVKSILTCCQLDGEDYWLVSSNLIWLQKPISIWHWSKTVALEIEKDLLICVQDIKGGGGGQQCTRLSYRNIMALVQWQDGTCSWQGLWQPATDWPRYSMRLCYNFKSYGHGCNFVRAALILEAWIVKPRSVQDLTKYLASKHISHLSKLKWCTKISQSSH